MSVNADYYSILPKKKTLKFYVSVKNLCSWEGILVLPGNWRKSIATCSNKSGLLWLRLDEYWKEREGRSRVPEEPVSLVRLGSVKYESSTVIWDAAAPLYVVLCINGCE